MVILMPMGTPTEKTYTYEVYTVENRKYVKKGIDGVLIVEFSGIFCGLLLS